MRSALQSRRSLALSTAAPLALIGAAVAVGAAGSVSLRSTITLVLCQLIVVIGLQVFVGNSGIYSFGQVGFAAIGAYLAALCTLPAAFASLQTPALPSWIANAQPAPAVAVAVAAGACALLAAVVALPLMRTSTLAIPISTFAFLIVVYNVIANWEAMTGGTGGLVSIPRSTGLLAAGAWAAGVTIVALAYKLSGSGYRLAATRESEVAARSLGIGVLRERTIAFALSAAICGIGGALAAHQTGVLEPSTFYFGATVTTLTMLVVGGVRSVFGAVVGSLAVALVNEVLHNLEAGGNLLGVISVGARPGLAAIGVGLILLAAMIALPSGISGGREAGELLAGRSGKRRTARVGAGRAAESSPPAEGALRAEGVRVAFGGLQVLEGVDLELRRGEALGLIGPNGAGKTTLLNVLSGFQRPLNGRIFLDGVEVTGLPAARMARAGLGRTFQGALPFAGLSGAESVAVGAMGLGASKREAVRRAGLVLSELELDQLFDRRAGSLSAAKQRLLGIARALAGEPRYLLLDEPAAGLDQAERQQLGAIIAKALRRFDCGVLLVEHELSVVARTCERVQVLDGGGTLRIGTPAEVQSDAAVAEAYLGSSFLVGADA
jgi:branched-chain amino acid transport system ATP-binding protein/branched-chain amino acid transport system permease protein